MKRKYFVSFSHKNGFACCDVTIDGSINEKYETVVKAIMTENNLENVVIMNYKRIWWWNKWL